jgi:hypothetical protein
MEYLPGIFAALRKAATAKRVREDLKFEISENPAA